MTPIKIEFADGFKVSQGDKYADQLSFGEMLEAVTALTREHQRTDIPIAWMKTKEEWEAYWDARKDAQRIFDEVRNAVEDITRDFEEDA